MRRYRHRRRSRVGARVSSSANVLGADTNALPARITFLTRTTDSGPTINQFAGDGVLANDRLLGPRLYARAPASHPYRVPMRLIGLAVVLGLILAPLAAEAQPPIRIGASASKTGPYAALGQNLLVGTSSA